MKHIDANKKLAKYEISYCDASMSTYPTYRVYPQQTDPQRAFYLVDPAERSVSPRYDPEIGNAVPADVYNGRVWRLYLPVADLTDEDLLALAGSIAEDLNAWMSTDYGSTEWMRISVLLNQLVSNEISSEPYLEEI